MRRLRQILTALMGLLFLLAVLVQYDDPDAARWMAIYGAAAAACLLTLRDRLPRWLPVAVAAVAAVWAATLAPGVVGRIGPGELFQEVGMASPVVEQAREMLGLVIVTLWMLVLVAPVARPRH